MPAKISTPNGAHYVCMIKAVLIIALMFAQAALAGYALLHIAGLPPWWGFGLASVAYVVRLGVGIRNQIERERKAKELIEALKAYEDGYKSRKKSHLSVVRD